MPDMMKKCTVLSLAAAVLLLMAACQDTPHIPTTEASGAQTAQTTVPTEETVTEPGMGVGERGDYGDGETVPPGTSETEPPETTLPGQTEPNPTGPESTTPENTTPEGTTPEDTTPEDGEPTTGGQPDTTVTFSQYLAMSVEEQEAFVNSFETLADFVMWWNAAKAAENEEEYITGDPSIDLGDMVP